MTVQRRLLASIHDVSPYHEARLERLVPLVEAAVGPGRFAMLVVPDFHRTASLGDNPGFAHKLRHWAEAGCEIFLHGYTHCDESEHRTFADRMKAGGLTADEGEFLGLDYSDAIRKLSAGRKLLEDLIGRPVSGFVAPAWLYSRGSLKALRDQGFTLAEDHFRVWNPQNGAVLTRGPVLTYASRSRSRLVSSILWSRIATVALARARTVRIAVHPHDVEASVLRREIGRAFAAFTGSHQPSAYAELAHDCGS